MNNTENLGKYLVDKLRALSRIYTSFEGNLVHKKNDLVKISFSVKDFDSAYRRLEDIEGNRRYVDDMSFIYLGYVLLSEEEGLAFVEAYRERALRGEGFDADLPVAPGAGSAGGDVLLRLRTNADAFSDERGEPAVLGVSLTEVPVLVERPGHHRRDPGGWVLFLDGHCEFRTYPGEFPMTPRFIEARCRQCQRPQAAAETVVRRIFRFRRAIIGDIVVKVTVIFLYPQ